RGNVREAVAAYESRFPNSSALPLIRKAPVAAMGADSALVALKPLADAFVEFLRPLTVLGRLAGVRRIPFNVAVPAATAGTSAGWVGERRTISVSAMGFRSVTFAESKVAGLVVLARNLVRSSERPSPRRQMAGRGRRPHSAACSGGGIGMSKIL